MANEEAEPSSSSKGNKKKGGKKRSSDNGKDNIVNFVKAKKGKLANPAIIAGEENSKENFVKAKKEKLANPAIIDNKKGDKGENLIKLNKTVFKLFNAVITDDTTVMKTAISQVILFLSKIKDNDEQKKHLDYCVKRCVRTCGSASLSARKSNAACLTSLLQVFAHKIPMEQVFQLVDKELKDESGRDDVHGVLGRIMVCSSIVRSGRLVNDETQIKQFTNILVNTTLRRNYQTRMAYKTFRHAFGVISLEVFKNAIWEELKKELLKPWPKQTIETVDTLISIGQFFPDVMAADVINDYWNGSELLSPKSYKDLHRIFFVETGIHNELPEVIDIFGSYIANSNNLGEFWKTYVEADLQNATRVQLRIILRILKIIFAKQTKPDWSNFLTTNFMKLFISGLKQQQKHKNKVSAQYFDDFTDALVEVCGKLDSDKEKVEFIYRLIKPPSGTFYVEKYAKTHIVHQMYNMLGKDGIMAIYDFYNDIFTGKSSIANDNQNDDDAADIDENIVRMDSGHIMQHLLIYKSVQDSVEWRCQKLCSLFTYGIFHVNEQLEVCKADEASDFSKKYNRQSKRLFFYSLKVHKSPLMENDLMKRLIDHVNLLLTKHKNQDKFINNRSFDETTKKIWTKMKMVLDSLSNDVKVPKALIILLQHLVIQLFNEPKTEESTINDLFDCIKFQRNGNSSSSNDSEELPWTHVLVDMSLYLLSLNNKLLRDLILMVYNNIPQFFDLNALHYILSLLSMEDGKNPLSNQNDDDSDDESDDAEGSDSGHNNDDENQKSDDNSEDEDSEDEDDDDDDETITEIQVLRNDLSQALMTNGASPMAGDDADSIDLNDLTEEQGLKLDEAIAGVFKARNKSQSRPNNHKKTKSYRALTTATMHFRLRVLNLVEIFSEQRNGSILIATTIMQSLYEMLQYCTADELKPLQNKTEKLLMKVISKTNYKISSKEDKQEGHIQKWNQMEVCSIIRQLVLTPILIKDHEIANRLLTNCFIFLILSGSRLPEKKKEENILTLCCEYIQEYINKRSAKVNFIVFTELFKSRWSGIWQLAKYLATQGILNQTRVYRRVQAYKLIILLYRNKSSLSELNKDIIKKNLADVEIIIYKHITELAKTNSKVKTTPKEVDGLFELILVIERVYNNDFQLYGASVLCNEKTPELMEIVRKRVSLNTMSNYKTYCGIHKLTVINNIDIASQMEDDDANDANQEPKNVDKKKALKRKKINDENIDDNNIVGGSTQKVSAKKQKKLKKEERLNAASRGLNGGFFQQQDADGVDDTSSNDN